MFGYIISRLLQAIPILILVSLIAFGIIYLIPGDAAVVIGGPSATPEELAQIRQNLGLDQPLHIQILTFYAHLFQGDLGRSLTLGIPVVDALLARSPITIGIAIYSLVLTILIGLGTGMLAAEAAFEAVTGGRSTTIAGSTRQRPCSRCSASRCPISGWRW